MDVAEAAVGDAPRFEINRLEDLLEFHNFRKSVLDSKTGNGGCPQLRGLCKARLENRQALPGVWCKICVSSVSICGWFWFLRRRRRFLRRTFQRRCLRRLVLRR